MRNNHIVIMAGGVGSRFWPLSTPVYPKQFIDILGCGRTLIQLTVDRFKGVCPMENFWVVTNAAYVDIVRKQLPDMPASHILAEPAARNTAPCIAWACWRIKEEEPESNVVVTPADAVVMNPEEFRRVINNALAFTSKHDVIVTIGIKPSRPETGYGYIKCGQKVSADGEIESVEAFKEKPDLAKTYDGFVYYHNAASFGTHTNSAVPALLGGYEYTPEAMNARSDKRLPDKYDEALKLMPSIFTKNGFDATMVNPTYAGYKWYPDLSVFDGMENVKAYSTKYSYLPDETKEIYESEHSEVFRHNLFCYSIFQSAPVALQKSLYDGGNYNDTRNVDPTHMISQKRKGNSVAYGHEQTFMWEYYTVKNLDQMTKVTDGEGNHFVYFATDIAHDVEMLQEPEYEPSSNVDNRKYDKNHANRFMRRGEFMWMRDAKDYKHYQCDVLAYTLIGRWLDYLKDEGVYDNTRIIIVADHGYYLENFPEMLMHDEIGTKLDGEAFAPLLMVKDFGCRGDLKTSEEFMTNADTPYLATKDLVNDPVNPFTGKPITDQGKKGTITVFHSNNWNIRNNNGYVYQPGDWFSLKDSIWKKENWGYLGNH